MLNHFFPDQVLQPPFTQPTTSKPCETQDIDANTTIRDMCLAFILQRYFSFLNADGGVNPPKYYLSHEEIDAACHAEKPNAYRNVDHATCELN